MLVCSEGRTDGREPAEASLLGQSTDRARRGIPISIAVEEGRTIGMQHDREEAVLKHLGHPTGGQ